MAKLLVPSLDLRLRGVEPALAHAALERLPHALRRALAERGEGVRSAGGGPGGDGALRWSATPTPDALARGIAEEMAGRLRAASAGRAEP